jgi:hypothetical protein
MSSENGAALRAAIGLRDASSLPAELTRKWGLENLRKEAEASSRALLAGSMQEQRFIRNVIVGFFVVLGVIGYFVGKWLERP